MPHVDAVWQYMRVSEAFATIHFTSGYRQLPMHPECPTLHAFMTQKVSYSQQGPRKEDETVQPTFRPVWSHASASCVTAS